MSLTTWFRDYLYIPLGGSRGSKANQVRNVFIVFLVSGFWHGANWTFVVWGLLNAVYFLPLLLFNKNRVHTNVVAEHRFLPSAKEFLNIMITFFITTLAWIFFRANTITEALDYMGRLIDRSLLSIPQVRPTFLIVLIGLFIGVEWLGRRQLYAIEALWLRYPKPVRWSLYYLIVMLIFLYGGKEQEFIYFQF
jgi:D-alanyl-lipoteichoic acid acyltransferase DltB (MBOAT superfamily)